MVQTPTKAALDGIPSTEKSSGLSGETPPTRTSKAFKLFQRNFHGLQNGLRSEHGQKIIYRDSRVPTIFGCFQNRATQHRRDSRCL